jgi:glutaconyl-CoA/methylmalonyl-CoA decarboxylase subunit gamma
VKLRIKLEGQLYDVEVDVLPDAASASVAAPEVDELERADYPPPPPDVRPQDLILHSPIAGLIVAIEVKPGQRVRQDETVILIEAMKMQICIGAPLDGTVEEIHVKPGDSVLPGQLLCTLG